MEVTEQGGRVLVFVYGSLMEGMGNHAVLRGAQRVDRLTQLVVHGPWEMLDYGGFPGLYVPAGFDGRSRVHGEAYLCDAETLAGLDSLEGHPSFYRREVRPVERLNRHPDSAHKMAAWVYVLTGQRAPHRDSHVGTCLDDTDTPALCWRTWLVTHRWARHSAGGAS